MCQIHGNTCIYVEIDASWPEKVQKNVGEKSTSVSPVTLTEVGGRPVSGRWSISFSEARDFDQKSNDFSNRQVIRGFASHLLAKPGIGLFPEEAECEICGARCLSTAACPLIFGLIFSRQSFAWR
jgi:hypothetical protein